MEAQFLYIFVISIAALICAYLIQFYSDFIFFLHMNVNKIHLFILTTVFSFVAIGLKVKTKEWKWFKMITRVGFCFYCSYSAGCGTRSIIREMCSLKEYLYMKDNMMGEFNERVSLISPLNHQRFLAFSKLLLQSSYKVFN